MAPRCAERGDVAGDNNNAGQSQVVPSIREWPVAVASECARAHSYLPSLMCARAVYLVATVASCIKH